MSKSKATNTDSSNDNPIQVLKQGSCPTTSGKSQLTYEVGIDDSDGIHLKISGNDGGGFWSPEQVAFTDIQAALKAWPEDQGVTSMTFRKIFRGKSANTPGFLIAVLCAEGIIQPMGDKKRVHQACDPQAFLASVQALRKGSGNTTSKKPAAKSKPEATATPKAKESATPKAKASPTAKKASAEKAKTPATGSVKTAKTPRKTK